MFGNLDPAADYDATDRAISDAMQAASTDLARTGVAGAWPRYDPAHPTQTVIGDSVAFDALAAPPLTELIGSLR